MTARRLEICIIVSIIGLIGIIYAFTQTPVIDLASAPTGQTQSLNANTDQTFEYPGADGQNALEILKTKHTVEVQHFDFGDMVLSIDGIKPDTSHFWAMYVNGELSQVGASAYVTKSTDTIKWQLDEITQ